MGAGLTVGLRRKIFWESSVITLPCFTWGSFFESEEGIVCLWKVETILSFDVGWMVTSFEVQGWGITRCSPVGALWGLTACRVAWVHVVAGGRRSRTAEPGVQHVTGQQHPDQPESPRGPWRC